MTTTAGVRLYWLPLGAGGHCVRLNGRVFEWLVSRRQHRPARDLYHCALEVLDDRGRWVVEMTPAWGGPGGDRGVVAEGAVGSVLLGASRVFRYEVRRWRDGVIPDLSEAVGGPQALRTDPVRVRRLLELVPSAPAGTWGRDEYHAGEMWNSNSLVSWLLARSGHAVDGLAPPGLGRAPGWDAGLAVARRQLRAADPPRQRSAYRSTGLPSGSSTVA